LQNSPSTSSPIVFEIIENNPTIIDVNNSSDEDQNKDLIEIGNNNKSEIKNEIENPILNICEPSPKSVEIYVLIIVPVVKFERAACTLTDVRLGRRLCSQSLGTKGPGVALLIPTLPE